MVKRTDNFITRLDFSKRSAKTSTNVSKCPTSVLFDVIMCLDRLGAYVHTDTLWRQTVDIVKVCDSWIP